MRDHKFTYFLHEGFSNMFSHGFMSFAAIGITVACLLIMGTFTLVAVNANELLRDLEQENEILAYVDDSYTETQAKALQKKHIKKILLLGTSEKMVQKIAMRLQLPTPSKIINITDVASQEDIETAQRSRLVEGKHVIPVPAIEIKRDYPKIFYNKVKIFFKGLKITDEKDKNSQVSEKSVVRPEFSKKGRIEISEAAITQMVMHCVAEHDSQIRVKKLQIKTNSRGYRLVVTIDIPFGTQLTGKIHNLQSYIINNIEKYTGILIEEVSIIIDKITQTENIKKR